MSASAPIELSCKVLVIGGGLAASSAARTAISFCTSVIVACKGTFGRSGSSPRRVSSFSQHHVDGGFQGNPSVMAETYVLDILEVGQYINDQHLVDLVTEVSGDSLSWSEWFGFLGRARASTKHLELESSYSRKLLRFMTPGHSTARTTPFAGTSEGFCDADREAIEVWGGKILSDLTITRLLTSEGRVVGATGFDVKTGHPYRIRAKSIILSAGGTSVLYTKRYGESETTGDAYALAYEAGAPLANMEFAQFSLFPADAQGRPFPRNDGLLYFGLGGTLLNNRGERLMKKALLLRDQIRLELSPVADLVTEVHHQIASGLGPVKSPGGEIDDSSAGLPYLKSLAYLNRGGYEWCRDGFEWAFGVERLLGGLKVNYRQASPVPGLYANGEASTGATGADCLPGYGEAYTMAGGSQAGAMAARDAVKLSTEIELPMVQVREEERSLRALGGAEERIELSELEAVEEKLRSIAWKNLGIWRNEGQLREAQKAFFEKRQDLEKRSTGNVADFLRKLELENTALTGYLIASAALHRKETRGQHRREDFPNRDDRVWLKEIVLTRNSQGTANIEERPVVLPRHKSRLVAHVENIYAKFPR